MKYTLIALVITVGASTSVNAQEYIDMSGFDRLQQDSQNVSQPRQTSSHQLTAKQEGYIACQAVLEDLTFKANTVINYSRLVKYSNDVSGALSEMENFMKNLEKATQQCQKNTPSKKMVMTYFKRTAEAYYKFLRKIDM